MEYMFMVGRILFGGYFVLSGVNHLRRVGGLSQYAAAKGLPAPKLAVIVSGLMMLFGGLGIVAGMYVTVAAALLAIFLVVAAFTMHKFWNADPTAKMAEYINFMKNIALAGAALMMMSIPAAVWSF